MFRQVYILEMYLPRFMGSGGYIDDPRPLSHQGKNSHGKKEMPDMVHAELALQSLFRQLTVKGNESRIIHQYINPSVLLPHLTDKCTDRIIISQVAKDKVQTPVLLLHEFLISLPATSLIPAEHDHRRSHITESLHGSPSHSGIRSRDDCRFSCQLVSITHYSYPTITKTLTITSQS